MQEADPPITNGLYFVALVIPGDAGESIQQIRLALMQEFGLKHALKSPPHLTLQMPLKLSRDQLTIMRNTLAGLASLQKPIRIKANGYGHFNQRVLFVRPNHNPLLEQTYHLVYNTLLRSGITNTGPHYPSYHPHITLANRDTKQENFQEYWKFISNIPLAVQCELKHFSLLIHKGTHWEILEDFPFMS